MRGAPHDRATARTPRIRVESRLVKELPAESHRRSKAACAARGLPIDRQSPQVHSSRCRTPGVSRPKSAQVEAVTRAHANNEIDLSAGITVRFATERPGMRSGGADVSLWVTYIMMMTTSAGVRLPCRWRRPGAVGMGFCSAFWKTTKLQSAIPCAYLAAEGADTLPQRVLWRTAVTQTSTQRLSYCKAEPWGRVRRMSGTPVRKITSCR